MLLPESLAISSAKAIEGYLQIFFVDGSILNVYNHCLFESVTIEGLKGRLLQEIRQDEAANVMILTLDKGVLLVDMRPEAYVGPEALGLYRPGQPIVIWN